MKPLKVIGTQFDSKLVEHTLYCLSATLSPVTKPAIARSFLTRFLGATYENCLHLHFQEQPTEAKQEKLYVVKEALTQTDFFGDSTYIDSADDVDVTICTETNLKATLKAKMTQCLEQANAKAEIEDLNIVIEWLKKNRTSIEQLGKAFYKDPIQWLVDTFDVFDLINEDILSSLSYNRLSLSFEEAKFS